MSNWSILISSFERFESLKETLHMLRESWPDVDIVVGDQSRHHPVGICREYNAILYELPHNCGEAFAINSLVHAVDGWFVFLDCAARINSRICDPGAIFRGVRTWGLVAATCAVRRIPPRKRQWYGTLELVDGVLYRKVGDPMTRLGGGWWRTEIVSHTILFSHTEMLRDNPMDESAKIHPAWLWCWRLKLERKNMAICMAKKAIYSERHKTKEYLVGREGAASVECISKSLRAMGVDRLGGMMEFKE